MTEQTAPDATTPDARPADADAAPATARRGMPEKRVAIARAARTVFGREGFTRTSVDAIAAEAGVSKRTIYNHFADKEQLFRSVILEGATAVAATQAKIADRHLRKIVDLRTDLVDFGLERVDSLTTFAEHWALVRTIEAEALHIRPAVLEAWQEAGPRETHRVLTHWMAEFAERGLLVVPDPAEAARMLNLLTFLAVAQPTFYGALPMPAERISEVVEHGVAAFLAVYGAPG
ncbi:TetR/AcrR family transcriptional regulator [Streptomyces sp. NRRL S-495]|uniref:TetR/AcrR family transcriptional regulator n=1 Tax=Streptomyces sp. NRRL S-495 TaxID=1609133 RepID=UPI0005F991F5|nr:TetR/AcrR family transcriptional regulator [Streptomyces sp. NRRL S-495]KJY33662.1 TetR family transcriptional regulator [Streptomyces sp. NRRL S-495]